MSVLRCEASSHLCLLALESCGSGGCREEMLPTDFAATPRSIEEREGFFGSVILQISPHTLWFN